MSSEKLSYKDELKITSAFLEQMRLRLSDKDTLKLRPEGKYYDSVEPNRKCLIGCLGPRPDPDFPGAQPPNSMGMILLVLPDAAGNIDLNLDGQFDVVHRYIPDLESMERDLVKDSGAPRKSQIISTAFKRYTIAFSDIGIQLSVTRANEWISAKKSLDEILRAHGSTLLSDERVMRLCKLNPNGGAKFYFDLRPENLLSQANFNSEIYAQIFDDHKKVLDYDVNIRARLRKIPAAFGPAMAGKYLLEVFLENATQLSYAKKFGVEFPCLLDSYFQLKIKQGTAHEVPHRLNPEDYRYIDENGLPGYGVTCSIRKHGETFQTESMPVFPQKRVDTPTPADVGMLLTPDYKALATDPLLILSDFVRSLEDYHREWDIRIDSLKADGKIRECDHAIKDRKSFETEVARVKDGVSLLSRNPDLLQCFKWMNETIFRAVEIQGKSFRSWRLFQLGFILTQIRAVFERYASVKELGDARRSADTADVLWFATGGGKTEAYLGIIALAMLYARKKGKLYGTTAWMRFPLRMLSVQQFQRMSYVIAQANIIRQREGLAGWPFTMGFYTGEGTPSRLTQKSDDNASNFLPEISDEKLRNYQFISDCPYCGTAAAIKIKKNVDRSRIAHVCTNANCWSNQQADRGSYEEGIRGEIGIFVSDEECYRYVPTVLVGTVDKLAVVAHNARFSNFFGKARHFCPTHGLTRQTSCEHRRLKLENDQWELKPCGNNTRNSNQKVVALPEMKDGGFSLLIQDELHLLRESLGNFDAHYETLLSALQEAQCGLQPKILAATATIKDYADHIHHLYLKEAQRFPAPGVLQGESFYARVARDDQGEALVKRWFAGIMPIGRGKIALQAVAEITSRFLDQVDEWRHNLKDDSSALMDQIGLDHAKRTAVLTHLEKNLNTNLVYANSNRNINVIKQYIDEIANDPTKRPDFRLLDGRTRLDLILDAIHHVENKDPDDPCRTIIATSVVSHGVDISELNFMTVAGWPKSTAEYIQASARSGRVHPGIVLCVLSSKQLFETGVFMNFMDYHNFLDKLVEAVPINRFAPNVLERTLPGVVSAIFLNWAKHTPWGGDLSNDIGKYVSQFNGSGSQEKIEQVKEMIFRAFRIPDHVLRHFDPRVVSEFNTALKFRVEDAMDQIRNLPGAKNGQSINETFIDIFSNAPFRSFRDIEPSISINAYDHPADNIFMALAR